VTGDPEHPFTAGFRGKVNHYEERVHSPERIMTPLPTGPKGARSIAPISWDEALDEITMRL